MFQSALSALSSTVVGAAKNTLNEYRPSNALKVDGAFDRLAQQGIANISYRSPVMANLAETMLQNVRLEVARKERINEYVKSDATKDFRGAVGAKLGTKSSRDIDLEMSRILTKISRAIDSGEEEEVKKSAIFKEYGKYFDEFKNTTSQKQESVQNNETPNDHSVGAELEHSDILHKIESNTQRTFNAIEELVTRMGDGAGMGGAGGKPNSGLSFIDPMTGMPSIKAAIGSIGGSFLTKVFDDETIDRFAKKAKKIFGFEVDKDLEPATDTVEPAKAENPVDDVKPIIEVAPVNQTNPVDNIPDVPHTTDTVEPAKAENPVDNIYGVPHTTVVAESPPKYTKNPVGNLEAITNSLNGVDLKLPSPKKSGVAKSVSDVLGDLSLDLNSTPEKETVITPSDQKVNTTVNESPNDEHLNLAIESLAELKKISGLLATPSTSEKRNTEKKHKSEKVIPREQPVTKTLKEKKDKVMGKLGGEKESIGAKTTESISKKIGGAEVAAGAESGGLFSGLVSGATALGEGAMAMAAAPAVVAAAPWVLGAAAVGAVGYGAYKMLSSDGKYEPIAKNEMGKSIESVDERNDRMSWDRIDAISQGKPDPTVTYKKSSPVADIIPQSQNLASQIENLSDKKEQQSAENNAAPIIINNSQAAPTQQAPQAPTIIVGTNVRNTESTFERVQMQDFWNRTA